MRSVVWKTGFIGAIFAVPGLLFLFMGCLNSDRVALDGESTELLGILFRSDTNYSQRYSHSKFNGIKIGMTEKEVLSLLGEPLVIWSPYEYGSYAHTKGHYVGYCYSEAGPSSGNYRFRQINFDHGMVVEINHSFYLD